MLETRRLLALSTVTLVSSSSAPVYGDSLHVTAAVSSSDPHGSTPTGLVQFSLDGAPAGPAFPLVNGAAVTPDITLPVGAHVIGASYSGDSTFSASTTTLPLTMGRAPLTVRADDKSKAAGTPNPQFTASFAGFVNGEGSGNLGGSLTFTTSATDTSPPGKYPITPKGLTSSNYAIKFVPGTITISKPGSLASMVSLVSSSSAPTYGDSVNFTATVSGSNAGGTTPTGTVQFLLDGSPVGPAFPLANGAVTSPGIATIPAGVHSIGTSYSGDTAFSPSTATFTLTVSPATLWVNGVGANKVYGQANPPLSASFSSFVLGQGPSVLGGKLKVTSPATTGSHVGDYPIIPGGLTSNNYAIIFNPGNLDITPAYLKIIADDKTFAQGHLGPLTASYVGLVNGDTGASLTTKPRLLTTATPSSPLGTYPITVQGAFSPDYFISYADGTLTIVTPGSVGSTVALVSSSRAPTYGDSVNFAATVSGTSAGDPTGTVQFLLDGSPVGPAFPLVDGAVTSPGITTIPAGAHLIGARYSGDSTFSPSTAKLSVTVGRAPLKVRADDKSKAAGAPIPAFTASFTGFVNGESPASLTTKPQFLTSATSDSPPGTYTITVHGASSPNYFISYVDGHLTIVPPATDPTLHVVSVTPTSGTYRSLPDDKVVVTFNQPLADITADDLNGGGFAKRPFAVSLTPRGPSGKFAAPSGLDAGSTRIPATLFYHINADKTSTITLIPRAPLSTDTYLITVSGALTSAGGTRLTDTQGAPGPEYRTFTIKATEPNGTRFKVVSVTTQHASVNIANNATIAQPDSIAVGFNKSANFLMLNNSTVQLLAGPSNRPVPVVVAYSPTSKAVYLTPTVKLVPRTKYTVRVSGSVTDDQGFPRPDTAYPLGKTFTRSFFVKAGAGPGTGPLVALSKNGHLLATPSFGLARTSPFGYASIPFSEPLDLSTAGRHSVMIIPQQGGLDNNGLDSADSALNARIAFNPNVNKLIIIPTVPTGNGIYWYTLNSLKAKNGDPLVNPGGLLPVRDSFAVALSGASASVKGSAVSAQAESLPASFVAGSVTAVQEPATSFPTGPGRRGWHRGAIS